MRPLLAALLLLAAPSLAACGGGMEGSPASTSSGARPASASTDVRPVPTESPARAAKRGEPKLRVPPGPPPRNLVVEDLIEGSGRKARPGDELTVEYLAINYRNEPFTNSWERSKPFRFRLGAGSFRVNPGWERGLPGMRAGGRRELIIPPSLQLQGGALPGSRPTDSLIYVIDLLAVE